MALCDVCQQNNAGFIMTHMTDGETQQLCDVCFAGFCYDYVQSIMTIAEQAQADAAAAEVDPEAPPDAAGGGADGPAPE